MYIQVYFPHFRVAGKGHSSDYWEENNVTNPTRDDYIFHIEFNHVHDYGLGILSDFGGIYCAASGQCEGITLSEYLETCYFYKHVFNNLIHDVHVYNYGGTLIYTDASSGKNTVENNLLIGAVDQGNHLYHHCGLDNVSKNNIIHRQIAKYFKNAKTIQIEPILIDYTFLTEINTIIKYFLI